MRPTEEETYMKIARLWAERSTCNRLHVGAVLTKDRRVISTGYNGSPPGMPHCPMPEPDPCDRAVHAEANALALAARYGIAVDGAQLWVTHAPCHSCALQAVSAGIVSVFYGEVYRSDRGLEILRQAGVQVAREGSTPWPAIPWLEDLP